MSERLDAAIREAKSAVEAYNEQRAKNAREAQAWFDSPHCDPDTVTDAERFLADAKARKRKLAAFDIEDERRRRLLSVARDRLDAAYALWLEESGLPKELGL